MAVRRPLVVGNWKMNGLLADGVARVRDLCTRVVAEPPPCDVLVCPPATLIAPVAEALRGSPVLWGGQDCHAEDKGAFTGDVAVAMLADLGCRAVIVGHSERRRDHGETDAIVCAKAAAAHRAGLIAIVCVGESLADRDAGCSEAVVGGQVSGSLPQGASGANTVIAYEPVWAIGTGRIASAEQIAAMHRHLRGLVRARIGCGAGDMRLLYGGSVSAANAAEILRIAEVDGALVGGASLKINDFLAICRSCVAA
ncbi:MAG: triose-phosphate isomerase [Alphaproteobacteria bacterium]|nr:triose-phosphate isomerase [Alphaproteobacteria bacterium]